MQLIVNGVRNQTYDTRNGSKWTKYWIVSDDVWYTLDGIPTNEKRKICKGTVLNGVVKVNTWAGGEEQMFEVSSYVLPTSANDNSSKQSLGAIRNKLVEALDAIESLMGS